MRCIKFMVLFFIKLKNKTPELHINTVWFYQSRFRGVSLSSNLSVFRSLCLNLWFPVCLSVFTLHSRPISNSSPDQTRHLYRNDTYGIFNSEDPDHCISSSRFWSDHSSPFWERSLKIFNSVDSDQPLGLIRLNTSVEIILKIFNNVDQGQPQHLQL